jgi:hypothetical protein
MGHPSMSNEIPSLQNQLIVIGWHKTVLISIIILIAGLHDQIVE